MSDVEVTAEISEEAYEAIRQSAERNGRSFKVELGLMIRRAAYLLDPEEAREQGLARGFMEKTHEGIWLTPILRIIPGDLGNST